MKVISVFFLFSSSILFSQEKGIVVDKIVAQIGNQIILPLAVFMLVLSVWSTYKANRDARESQ
jgi:hypothetical protein